MTLNPLVVKEHHLVCGQAPSDHPEEYPPFLIECGITSISVTPDTAIAVRIAVDKDEKELALSNLGE